MLSDLTKIRNSILFRGVSEEDAVTVLQCLGATKKHFKKDEYIIHQGECSTWVGLILTGSALIAQIDYWGNRHIITYLDESSIFGESLDSIYDSEMGFCVVADQDCSVLTLNYKRMLTVCRGACEHHMRLIQNLVQGLAAKNRDFLDKITILTQRSTKDKLLNYLSNFAVAQGSAHFTIPFSRQELADYLAVDRSALSSVLAKLQKDGVLNFHKNQFELLSPIER